MAKKAKKLGVSVEELKNKASETTNTSMQSSVSEQTTTQNYVEPTVQPAYTSYSTVSPQTSYSNYTQPTYTTDTRENKFALIGYPLGHSLSKEIHNAGFKSLGLTDASYEILETRPDELVERIKMLKAENYKGFNVTIPLKLPIAMFVDEVDVSADIVGAINTVVINQNKTLKGYNTDVIGFRNAIPTDITLAGKVAGILGTGGAARAACVALAQEQVREIRFYTRSIPNSLKLVEYMQRKFPDIRFEAFQIEFIRDLSMVDILVNATPIGMLGRSADMTPVEKPQLETLPKNAIVYDVIYNPKKTLLLKLSESLGFRTINGIEMLVRQAFSAEEIWTGNRPNFDAMKIALLENL